jgi:tRNA-specific 2-thiouridylase
MPKTAVLLSGGVDSSVALCRLSQRDESQLEAFYLKIWLEDELAFLGTCPWQDDLEHARQVCERVGVGLRVVPLQAEYLERVVGYALAELKAGRTPSPDVLCNRSIKFGAFLDHIDDDFELVASGHYARLSRRQSTVRLLRGVDPVKDQSYFLCQLDQDQLRRCLFPVGDLTKAEVRGLARDWDLGNADRPDSQGICFLGRVPYDDFIRHHLGERCGPILEHPSGRALGEHRGYWFFTIGQRRGLGLAGGPWYVLAKEVERNVIWVVHGSRLNDGGRQVFHLPSPHWVAEPPTKCELEVRVRHGERLAGCRLRDHPDGGLEIELAEPDPGIAPGQFAVLYDDQLCLGGGAIGR